MVFVASEMERRGFKLPLLIGGATTSKQHTAVKIAPVYENPTVHVLDASRAVDVVSTLLNPERAPEFDRGNRNDQATVREQYTGRARRPLLPYSDARNNAPKLEWHDVPVPAFTGRRFLDDEPLRDIAKYIDWTLFFSTWELKGSFPAILKHPEYGAAATDLFEQAQELLGRIVESRLLRARGSYGFWPAHSVGDDIVVYTDDTRSSELLRFNMLRQQESLPSGQPNRSLADFVAPRSSGVADYIGAFAVTAGLGADELVRRYERQRDDYRAIMVKALADRLAEAFSEYLHARVRRDWGYGISEALTNEDLIGEKYCGIRPAFGYPACPDHTEKLKLFDLLAAERVGIKLTESCAMIPAASVSGLYLSHPQARYFMLGRIGRDQLESYASRKSQGVEETAKWLGDHVDVQESRQSLVDSR
jgi:5-methyltetrahydrofolate--homocysteine methyltransferase